MHIKMDNHPLSLEAHPNTPNCRALSYLTVTMRLKTWNLFCLSSVDILSVLQHNARMILCLQTTLDWNRNAQRIRKRPKKARRGKVIFFFVPAAILFKLETCIKTEESVKKHGMNCKRTTLFVPSQNGWKARKKGTLTWRKTQGQFTLQHPFLKIMNWASPICPGPPL